MAQALPEFGTCGVLALAQLAKNKSPTAICDEAFELEIFVRSPSSLTAC